MHTFAQIHVGKYEGIYISYIRCCACHYVRACMHASTKVYIYIIYTLLRLSFVRACILASTKSHVFAICMLQHLSLRVSYREELWLRSVAALPKASVIGLLPNSRLSISPEDPPRWAERATKWRSTILLDSVLPAPGVTQ
jgi:hypothetical protein